jgi:hypothetical protein
MTQQTKTRQTTERQTETIEETPQAPQDREQKLAEIDEILDSLDDVLDENEDVQSGIATERLVEEALTELEKQRFPCDDCREAGYCPLANGDFTAIFID